MICGGFREHCAVCVVGVLCCVCCVMCRVCTCVRCCVYVRRRLLARWRRVWLPMSVCACVLLLVGELSLRQYVIAPVRPSVCVSGWLVGSGCGLLVVCACRVPP